MPTIGERIRQLRGKVFTQADLAQAAGVSVDVVRKLEQGRRHTASIGTLQRIARVLDVDPAELLPRTRALPSKDAGGVVGLRDALTGVGDLLDAQPGPPVGLAELSRTTGYAWGLYWSGHYDRLAALLPLALADSRVAERAAGPTGRARAVDLSAQLHQLAACTAVHVGQPDLAHIAGRAALRLAGAGDDALRDAGLRGTLAWLLLTQGRYAESQRLAEATAAAVQPGASSPEALSVYGSLLLTAACAAGRRRRARDAETLLEAAGQAAARLGTDRNDYEVAFGPAQVVMQTVDVQVVTDDHAAALRTALRMAPDAALPLAARSRHLADVAFAQAQLGRDRAALATLLRVEQAAPAWMRYQSLPRQVIRELLERERRAGAPGLRDLAKRMEVSA